MRQYGLIGRHLSHSFSPHFFEQKFLKEAIDASYKAYELVSIDNFTPLVTDNPSLQGLNVTIPYKQEIIPYLDTLDSAAKTIGAVNCIHFIDQKKIGYNTDWIGFTQSLQPLLKDNTTYNAIIFGNGGAALAIKYALQQLGISFITVSRNPRDKELSYTAINQSIAHSYNLWINTTPVGMYPNIEASLPLPSLKLSKNTIFYDLIYNPSVSSFLQHGLTLGATVKNGLDMLHYQALEAWRIWNKNS